MLRRLPSALAAVALAAALAPTAPARADATAADKETARSLMDDGYARHDRGDHAGALRSFQGADAIMHVPTTSLEVAREQAALGQVVEARDTLIRVLRPPAAGEPEPFRVARAAARSLDADLAGRVAGLRVTLRGFAEGDAPALTIDGAAAPVAALEAPYKVNPGHHVVAATAKGGSARGEVDVAAGETKGITLAFAPAAAPALPPPAPLRPPPARSAVPRVLEIGGLSLAAAGVAVGAVAGGLSLAATSSAKSGCSGDKCPPTTWGDIDSAHTTATIATAGFVVAGAGAAAALAGFLLDRRAPAPSGRLSLSPWLTAGGGGLAGTF